MSVAYQFQREVSSLLQGRGLGTLGISMVSVLFNFLIWCYISVCLFPYKILCLKYFTITLLKRKGSVFKKLESQWATTRGSGMLIFEVTMVSKQPSVAPSRSDLLKPILPSGALALEPSQAYGKMHIIPLPPSLILIKLVWGFYWAYQWF